MSGWAIFRNGSSGICMELAPSTLFAIEACGTGSGFLYEDDSADTAHFRGKIRGRTMRLRNGFVQPHFAAGLAELQVADDASGFHFGSTDSRRVETAELSCQPSSGICDATQVGGFAGGRSWPRFRRRVRALCLGEQTSSVRLPPTGALLAERRSASIDRSSAMPAVGPARAGCPARGCLPRTGTRSAAGSTRPACPRAR